MKLAMTRLQQILALLADFQTQYPALIDLDNPKPLKIGTFQDLCARHPEQNRPLIRQTLGFYTRRDRYLKALVDAGKRYDLDGHAVGEVTPEQHDAALTELNHRAEERAEQARRQKARKKAHRKAARQAAAAPPLDAAPPPPPSPPPAANVPHPSSTPRPSRRPIIALKKTARA